MMRADLATTVGYYRRPSYGEWMGQERPTASRRTVPLSSCEGRGGEVYDGFLTLAETQPALPESGGSFLLLVGEGGSESGAETDEGCTGSGVLAFLGPPHSLPSLTPSLRRGEDVSEGTSLNNRRCNTGRRRARCKSGRSGPGSGKAVRRGAAAWWPGR